MVLLYCLITDGSSINQSAFLFSNTGFLNTFRIVLMTRSAFDGPLSVNRE